MFGDFIHKNIQSTLFNRIDALNRNHDKDPLSMAQPNTNQDSFLMGATWARVTSAVPNPIKDSNGDITDFEEDKLFRLSSDFSPTTNKRINEPLSITSDSNINGTYRAHNGVTGITVSYLNQTTLATSISWFLNDINDFETYQNALLKLSRVVLVEFGWSKEKPQEIPDIETSKEMLDFFKANQSKMVGYGGDYFATCGTIKNFNYNLVEGGRYECTTELTSMGQQLFKSPVGRDKNQVTPSIVNEFQEKNVPEVNKRLKRLEGTKLDEKGKKKIKEIILNSMGNSYETVISKLNSYIINLTAPSTSKKNIILKHISSGVGKEKSKQNKNRGFTTSDQTYTYKGKSWCTWGWFEDNILNTYFGLLIKKSPENNKSKMDDEWIARFNSSYRKLPDEISSQQLEPDSMYEPNLCKSDKNLFTKSFDIIFPGRTIEMSEKIKEGLILEEAMSAANLEDVDVIYSDVNKFFPAFEPVELRNNRGIIRNIVFSADYLKKHFTGTTTIGQSIKSLWADVNVQYGGFWDFDMLSDIEDPTMVGVFDRKITRMRVKDAVSFPHTRNLSTKENPFKSFQFKVYSKDSLVKEMTFATQMSAEMMTQAAYSGNNSNTVTKSGMFGGVPEDKDGRAVKAFSALQNFNYLDEKMLNKQKEAKQLQKDQVLDSVTTPYMLSQVSYRDEDGSLHIRTPAPVTSGHEEQYKEAEAVMFADEQEDELNKKLLKTYKWFDVDKALNDRGLIYHPSGKMFDTISKTMLYLLNSTDKAQRSVDVLIPFTCSFSISGISGIKLYDYFTIDYMPELYRKYSVFQVTAVNHTLDSTGWTTGIEGMMRVDMDTLADDLGKDVPDDTLTKIKYINDMHTIELLNSTLIPTTPPVGVGTKHASQTTKFTKFLPGMSGTLNTLKGIEDEAYEYMARDKVTTWTQYRQVYSGVGTTTKGTPNSDIRQMMLERIQKSNSLRRDLFKYEKFPDLSEERVNKLRSVRQSYSMPLDISTPKRIYETSR
jgi:hypothetical protein